MYEIGISLLLDVSWVEAMFQREIPENLASGKCPKGLLQTTLSNGLLNYLGGKFFDMLFNVKNDSYYIDVVDVRKNLDILNLMFFTSGLEIEEKTPPYRKSLAYLVLLYDDVEDVLLEFSDDAANDEFKKRSIQDKIYSLLSTIEEEYQEEIVELRKLYAANFAERVFHDRQLCEYISYVVASAYKKEGFPILNLDKIQRVSSIARQKMPSWVFETLRARERDKCANCGKALSELKGEFHIDHIVPLSKFGINDIVNLQLLCENCNLLKTNNYEKVASSVPKYFSWKRSMN
jgi:5-methylcytosine-specific restriction endonuclease McrA